MNEMTSLASFEEIYVFSKGTDGSLTVNLIKKREGAVKKQS